METLRRGESVTTGHRSADELKRYSRLH